MAKAFVYSVLAALLIAIHSSTAFKSKILTKMTKAEKLAIFGESLSDVGYEVFPMSISGMKRIRKSKANITCTLLINAEEITLNLAPTPQYLATKYTPVWSAVSDRRSKTKIKYNSLKTAMSGVGEFTMYQDVEHSIALVVYTDPTEDIVIDGLISTWYIIKSLPKRLNKMLRKEVDLTETSSIMGGAITSDDDAHFYVATFSTMFTVRRSLAPQHDIDVEPENHEIVKRSKGKEGKQKVKKTSQIPKTAKKIVPIPKTAKKIVKIPKTVKEILTIPKTVYPEMLIVLDHNVVRYRNTTQALRNVLAFWNGVDLIYRTLEKPKIHLNIAGIIIAADDTATPYIAKDSDLDSILSKMGKHFYTEQDRFPTTQYDIIIAMTTMNLPAGNSDSCDNCVYLPGYFTKMPVCSSKRNMTRTKTLNNTMLIHYDGSFSREHLFLVRNYHGNGKIVHCDSEDYSDNRIKWSTCSQKFYSDFLATKETKCLRNNPLSMDGQCQSEGYAESCKFSKKIGTCVVKGCKAKGSKTCHRTKRVPRPGTTCGTNQYCNEKKQCVRK